MCNVLVNYHLLCHTLQTRRAALPPASCLLPPASCLLPPASCLLPPASCLHLEKVLKRQWGSRRDTTPTCMMKIVILRQYERAHTGALIGTVINILERLSSPSADIGDMVAPEQSSRRRIV